jgi:putative transposase
MANTYTQIHIQMVFVVEYRDAMIKEEWEDELYKYMIGIIQNYGHKVLQINGMPDHVHVFIGMRPTQALSDLMEEVKGSSSKWINEKKFSKHKFAWQGGFAAFSYTKSHEKRVIAYIKNQKEHHKKVTFREEYLKFLEWAEIEFKEQYIFKDPR